MSQEDARIIESVLGGKSDAFGLLIDKYGDLLFKYVVVLFGHGDSQAEDICQETLIASFSGLGTLANRDNFKGRLFGIATNKVHTAFRDRTRARTAGEGLAALAAAPDEGPAAGEAAELARQMVARGLHALPDEMREVIALKYFGNLSYDDMAAALGVPRSTVRGRMYRAYQILRETPQKDGTRGM